MHDSIKPPYLDQNKLSQRGITFKRTDDADSSITIAKLIYQAMNDTENPRYTDVSGGKSIDAITITKDTGIPDDFNETDLFIHLHAKERIIQTDSSLEKKEIVNAFKRYGVILLNGLNPKKNKHLLLGCGHDNGHCPHIKPIPLTYSAP